MRWEIDSRGVTLDLRLADTQELSTLLERGGFFVASWGEPWGDDEFHWQAFHCGRYTSMATVSAAVFSDGREPGFVNVAAYRRIVGRFCWPSDRRLARDIAAWLIENGATESRPGR